MIAPIDNANEAAVSAFSSTNGGASWSAINTITTIRHHTVAGGLREGPLPSAEIDGAGTVYVVWVACRFRRSCRTNDLVISHSLNATGTSWSAVSRVPIDATNSSIDHTIPSLAVNKATSGSSTSCSTSALDNCAEPTDTFASGLTAGGSASSVGDPVVFGGNGNGDPNSLWKVVDNNGSKHRD